MFWLRQGTEVIIPVGPFVDAADGKTRESGVTLQSGGAHLFKHGGTAVAIDGATWSEITGHDGMYHLTITTSLSDTLGSARVTIQNPSVHLPVQVDLMFVPANVWDSLFGTDLLQVDAREMYGSAQGAQNLSNIEVEALTGFVFAYAIGESGSGIDGGSGGSGDWTETEKQQIRHRLGIDGTTNAPSAEPSLILAYGLDHLVMRSVAGADVADNSIIAKLVSAEATADWDDYDNEQFAMSAGTSLTEVQMQALADEILKRGITTDVENEASRHSLAAVIMISTNSDTENDELFARRPSDDGVFATYQLVVAASVASITGIS